MRVVSSSTLGSVAVKKRMASQMGSTASPRHQSAIGAFQSSGSWTSAKRALSSSWL